MAMWDLPEQKSVRKKKNQDMSDTANTLLKTTSDFMLAGVGITAMAGLGTAMIGALKPK